MFKNIIIIYSQPLQCSVRMPWLAKLLAYLASSRSRSPMPLVLINDAPTSVNLLSPVLLPRIPGLSTVFSPASSFFLRVSSCTSHLFYCSAVFNALMPPLIPFLFEELIVLPLGRYKGASPIHPRIPRDSCPCSEQVLTKYLLNE